MSIWQRKSRWKMLIDSWQAENLFDIDWIKVEKRKVSLWEYWLFVIWIEEKISDKNKKDLLNLCKKENTLFIQIETINYKNKLFDLQKEFSVWYYKKFITPYTAVIGLDNSEDEILKNMKQKWRYNIRLAVKKWVVVKEVSKTKENIKEFYNLMLETTSRDNFFWNKLEFYEVFLNSLENSSLLLAYKGEKVICGWIFIFDKDVSIYYYWASTSSKEYRNLMAPYLLQWEAIKRAKNYWSVLYDFLWVSEPNKKNTSLSWVTDFKLKLTKDVRDVSNSYIFVNKRLKYFFILLLRKLGNI